jgi:hypothetical protein
LTSLSSDDTKNILKQAQNIDKDFAKVLGPKLPKNTSLSEASKGIKKIILFIRNNLSLYINNKIIFTST